MSLDFAILGNDGCPAEEVRVGAEEHSKLIQFARRSGCVILLRAEDYYVDAGIAADEVGTFKDEIATLRKGLALEDGVKHLLVHLETLAEKAKNAGKPIAILTD